jgi:uncharacterized protein (TIGR02145 family)
MKKNLLLMMMCCPMVLAAQNGVTVLGLAIDAGTVTFNVSWTNTGMPTPWSDTVWVFVDYNNAGKMERLPLLPGATLTATSPGGKVIEEPDNNKGVWVAGNARSAGSFSAAVKLLTAIKDVGGACVYGSNYPPVGEYSSDAPMLSFTGTPMYEIQLAHSGGGNVTVKSGNTFLLPCDYTLTSFTDATGAPGLLGNLPVTTIPPHAASTQTWIVGTSTLIWSDVINVTATCNKSDFGNSNTEPRCRSYTTDKLRYYYNWPYANQNADVLCPSPWRVPTILDFIALDKALGGTGVNRTDDFTSVVELYTNDWGGESYPGFAFDATVTSVNWGANFWSATEQGPSTGYHLGYNPLGLTNPQQFNEKYYGLQVRCVK